MNIIKWEKPSRPGSKCIKCGKVAIMEYSATDQCEPDKYTLWKPYCIECRNDEPRPGLQSIGCSLPSRLPIDPGPGQSINLGPVETADGYSLRDVIEVLVLNWLWTGAREEIDQWYDKVAFYWD